ncbi:hypothetical protein BC936DRAFT_147142 [Jimgerdemannia flammicorona]|uniref:AAA-ATPase-like domain-containing protein n=1 Tax=Jimgerdemannia flammicorona TaxID=994334 RepID=A0A433DL65_9FUNG|nr:hypothetical protein BC936DRAFT_147142 [Jimgerdemannia flammicorona]
MTGVQVRVFIILFSWPELPRVPVIGANDAALLPGGTVSVGSSNFKKLMESRFSVIDKSMLIAEFASTADEVTLVLHPRQFGKTTNLSMLHFFFERIDGKSKHEHELWHTLFGSMKIAKERPDVMMNEFGKYPVVFLSLKDVIGKMWNDMSRLMQTTISQIYNEHAYLCYHQQKCIVLTDEYDVPISSAYHNRYYEDVMHFL